MAVSQTLSACSKLTTGTCSLAALADARSPARLSAFSQRQTGQRRTTKAVHAVAVRAQASRDSKVERSQSVQSTVAAAVLAVVISGAQVGPALAESYSFNPADEQTQAQQRAPEASGKENTRAPGLLQGGPNAPPGPEAQKKGNTFSFDTADEQTIAQNRQGEGSGKASSRQPGAGRSGPTEGVKRASSSQASASEDFPGRATRTLGKAKDAVEDLLPGQPGKALESATRGTRLGKALSDAGLNENMTVAAAFDFNTADEQTQSQNRQQEGSGKANTRDNGAANAGPTSGVKRASSSQAAEEFPGRATRVLGKAKEAAADLLPGQPGKALENTSRGIRLGKAVSDASVNPVTTLADASLQYPREGLADARESFQSNRLEARRVSKEAREGIMQDNAEKLQGGDSAPKTVQELVASKAKLIGKVNPLQDGTDSAAPGQARGKSFY